MKGKLVTVGVVAALLSGAMLTACSNKKADEKPPHVHSYDESVVAPTCVADGYTIHTCNCGESYTDNATTALGHSYTDWIITSDAHSRGCDRCDEIWETAHSYTDWIITSDGHSRECEVCNGTWSGAHTISEGKCTQCEWAAPQKVTLNYEPAEDGASYSVVGYTGDATTAEIPATYNNLPVKQIGNGAFKNSGITTVVIPNGIERLGDEAFAGSKIQSVVIPATVTVWGNKVFYGSTISNVKIDCGAVGKSAFETCKSLVSVEFSDKLKQIYDKAFYSCHALEGVQIPSGATINYCAFAYTKELKSVDIGAGVSWNSSYAFWKSGVRTVTSHSGIGGAAFDSCVNLDTVVIELPEGNVGTISSQAFNNSGLANITISRGITSIGQLAFAKCKNLKTIVIPDTVTAIGTTTYSSSARGVFMESGLTEIVIPDSVETLNDWQAFENCVDLKSIHIGKNMNVKSSRWYHFSELLKGCNALETITVSDEHPHYYAKNNCLIDKRHDITLDKMGKNVKQIPQEITHIGIYAFYGNTELTSFTVPEGITYINTEAFYGCTNLATVQLPSTLKYIESSAFANCGIAQITLPASLLGIDEQCFKGCTQLNSVTFLNPTGWRVIASGQGATGGEPAPQLNNTAKNAEYLKTQYCEMAWRRS